MAADKPDFPAAAAIGQPRKPYRSAKHLLLPPRYHSPAWNTRLDDPEKIFRQSVSHALYRHRTRNTPDRSVPQNRSMGGHPSLFEKPPPVTSLSDDRTQFLYESCVRSSFLPHPTTSRENEKPSVQTSNETVPISNHEIPATVLPLQGKSGRLILFIHYPICTIIKRNIVYYLCFISLFSYFATKLQKTVFYDDSSRIFYCSTSHIHHAGRRLYLLPNG